MSIYKNLRPEDKRRTKTLLHEYIPITGTIISGTYAEDNIKNYTHGMFQSVYDYPYLSSSANQIFDLTIGYSSNAGYASDSDTVQNQKKLDVYNQMSLLLVGTDNAGNLREFDRDGDFSSGGGKKLREVFFICFNRLLVKDGIKKGSFVLTVANQTTAGAPNFDNASLLTIGDYGAATEYKTNSPVGEYGILYTSSAEQLEGFGVGLIYYNAGVVVLTSSIFGGEFGNNNSHLVDSSSIGAMFSGSEISASCEGLRNRWYNCYFNNTVELNSTIYFCRVNNNDFNYSSNPTYLSGSKIRTKENAFDSPKAYITTIGLYSPDNELMAVAKVSEPLKSSPESETTLRVRLDY